MRALRRSVTWLEPQFPASHGGPWLRSRTTSWRCCAAPACSTSATSRPASRLTGGVSSDIWRVDLPRGSVCVKRALAKLRVKADWRAPVERNGYEAAWMRIARRRRAGGSAASCSSEDGPPACRGDALPPAGPAIALWKTALRDGEADPAIAAAVGGRLAAHPCRDRRACRHRGSVSDRCDLPRHPARALSDRHRPRPSRLAPALRRLARRTATTKLALVHGDVSPKNIMVGPDGPVFLDAECAWYGDPAFDLAFCLNHLLLKCLWVPAAAPDFLDCYDAWRAAIWRRRLGAARRARGPRRRPAARAVPGPDRRQVAGGIRHRRCSTRSACAASPAPSCWHRPRPLASLREAWAVELGV